jgi:hypothetical protein
MHNSSVAAVCTIKELYESLTIRLLPLQEFITAFNSTTVTNHTSYLCSSSKHLNTVITNPLHKILLVNRKGQERAREEGNLALGCILVEEKNIVGADHHS